jgi:HEAT repeat protein
MPNDIESAFARLRSTHDELGVLDVIALGERAIPALRTVLFEGERSGLYQTRCRAVQALSALGAHDTLIEFLEHERPIGDPIERVGEDAVINAAALALARIRTRRVFELLLRLARRPALTGVIGALGNFESSEAIQALMNALEEDASRLTAESALRKLGVLARAALLSTVDLKVPTADSESESSARRRRAALRLLAEMDTSPDAWRDLRHLMHDKDARVAAFASEITLARSSAAEQRDAILRLIELLSQEDWVMREEIENSLVAHYESASRIIAEQLRYSPRRKHDAATERQIGAILSRIVARAQTDL